MRTSGALSQLFPPGPEAPPEAAPLEAGVLAPLAPPTTAFSSFSFRLLCLSSTSFFAAKGSGLHSQARCAGAAAFSAVSVDQYGRIEGGSVMAMGRCEQNWH